MRRFAWLLSLASLLWSGAAAAQTQTSPADTPPEDPAADGSGDDGAGDGAGDEAPGGAPGRFRTGLTRSPTAARRGERVEFNLEDGDLMDLVRMMTSVTGRRFLISGVQRQVRATIASTQPVTAGEAYQAFLTVLHANGLTVVQRGRYHLIVESDNVERQVLPVYDDARPPGPDERFVTWIHRVRHVTASEAAQLLEPLRSPEAVVVTYDATQTLIVIDTGASIRRLRRILREVDVPNRTAQIWVEPIHYADAEELRGLLEQIFEGGEAEGAPASSPAPRAARTAAAAPGRPDAPAAAEAPGAPLRILSDPRTNALILLTTQPTYARIMGLLRTLDRPDGEQLSVHVRRLQHGDAETVAATLTGLLGGGSSGASPAAGARSTAARAAAAPNAASLSSSVSIQAHSDLNAIVVTASRADYRAIEQLIEELDTPPRQVFLEMVLLEVSVSDDNSFDSNIFTGLASLFGTNVLGLLTSLGTGVDPTGVGTSLSLFGPLITDSRLPDGSIPEFGLQLQAVAQNVRTNIVATPHITALDNREATINIGENVPLQSSAVSGSFLTSALAGQDAAAGQAALSQLAGGSSGGRRDTGTIVTVTPHINDDGEIRLELRAEDSRQSERSGNLGAATLAQSIAETELVARDGETVVIGGLTREQEDLERNGIPILSEIPILGMLFGGTSDRRIKRDLLFFVTPHIIRRPSDMRAIMERRLRERRELLERAMAFDDDWEPPVDYARTRGLVGEMLTAVDAINEEVARASAAIEPPPEHVLRPPVDLALEPSDEPADEPPVESEDAPDDAG